MTKDPIYYKKLLEAIEMDDEDVDGPELRKAKIISKPLPFPWMMQMEALYKDPTIIYFVEINTPGSFMTETFGRLKYKSIRMRFGINRNRVSIAAITATIMEVDFMPSTGLVKDIMRQIGKIFDINDLQVSDQDQIRMERGTLAVYPQHLKQVLEQRLGDGWLWLLTECGKGTGTSGWTWNRVRDDIRADPIDESIDMDDEDDHRPSLLLAKIEMRLGLKAPSWFKDLTFDGTHWEANIPVGRVVSAGKFNPKVRSVRISFIYDDGIDKISDSIFEIDLEGDPCFGISESRAGELAMFNLIREITGFNKRSKDHHEYYITRPDPDRQRNLIHLYIEGGWFAKMMEPWKEVIVYAERERRIGELFPGGLSESIEDDDSVDDDPRKIAQEKVRAEIASLSDRLAEPGTVRIINAASSGNGPAFMDMEIIGAGRRIRWKDGRKGYGFSYSKTMRDGRPTAATIHIHTTGSQHTIMLRPGEEYFREDD